MRSRRVAVSALGVTMRPAALLSESRQHSLDVSRVAYLGCSHSYPHLRSRGFDHTQKSYVRSDFRNVHDSNTAQPRRDLTEISEPFPADRRLEIVEARNFSSGMRQVRDETASDRIGYPCETTGMERVALSVAATTEFVETRITSGASPTISSATLSISCSLSPVNR